MINGKHIAVVLPAYNAEKTLEATVRELPETVDIRILVDDNSSDRTVEAGGAAPERGRLFGEDQDGVGAETGGVGEGGGLGGAAPTCDRGEIRGRRVLLPQSSTGFDQLIDPEPS